MPCQKKCHRMKGRMHAMSKKNLSLVESYWQESNCRMVATQTGAEMISLNNYRQFVRYLHTTRAWARERGPFVNIHTQKQRTCVFAVAASLLPLLSSLPYIPRRRKSRGHLLIIMTSVRKVKKGYRNNLRTVQL